MKKQLPEMIRTELEASKVPWRIENGGRHLKLFIGDRMVGVMPYDLGEARHRALLNLRAQIRRVNRSNT